MPNYEYKEDVNEFVGILENGAYIFLDYVFKSSDKLFGATGTVIHPVSEEYVEERIEEMKDYEWSPLAHIYDEQDTPMSWDEWINQHSRRELEELVVDPSGGNYWDKTRKLCEEHEEFEFYTTDCVGGGRIFSNGNEGNAESYEYLESPELLEKAQKAETGELFEELD
jgi:hypothetical protein